MGRCQACMNAQGVTQLNEYAVWTFNIQDFILVHVSLDLLFIAMTILLERSCNNSYINTLLKIYIQWHSWFLIFQSQLFTVTYSVHKLIRLCHALLLFCWKKYVCQVWIWSNYSISPKCVYPCHIQMWILTIILMLRNTCFPLNIISLTSRMKKKWKIGKGSR